MPRSKDNYKRWLLTFKKRYFIFLSIDHGLVWWLLLERWLILSRLSLSHLLRKWLIEYFGLTVYPAACCLLTCWWRITIVSCCCHLVWLIQTDHFIWHVLLLLRYLCRESILLRKWWLSCGYRDPSGSLMLSCHHSRVANRDLLLFLSCSLLAECFVVMGRFLMCWNNEGCGFIVYWLICYEVEIILLVLQLFSTCCCCRDCRIWVLTEGGVEHRPSLTLMSIGKRVLIV